jgi:predicted ATP-dependent protease
MKVACIPDKVSDEKSMEQLISSIEEDERTPGLDTLAITEFVKQRRRDALRIKELTLRAIETLENPNNNMSKKR